MGLTSDEIRKKALASLTDRSYKVPDDVSVRDKRRIDAIVESVRINLAESNVPTIVPRARSSRSRSRSASRQAGGHKKTKKRK
jgi:hypothetical protein